MSRPVFLAGLTLFIAATCLVVPFVTGADRLATPEQIAERALAARERIMQQHATVADVDAFLALCTDNLVYEDPVVNVRITGKTQIREGMLGFLGVTRNVRRSVTRRIAAANVVVLEQAVSFEENEGNVWKPRKRDQVTVLEFDGTKIRRLADYWAR